MQAAVQYQDTLQVRGHRVTTTERRFCVLFVIFHIQRQSGSPLQDWGILKPKTVLFWYF